MLERQSKRDETLKAEIAALGTWFHNIEIDGVATAPDHPLGDYPRTVWRHIKAPLAPIVKGRSVLDIGCNGGFFSIEMVRLGASSVIGIDHDARYLAQARFAAQRLGIDIDFRKLSVYDVAALNRRFDVVLFMGVLYHLRHPLLALDLISEHVAGDYLVFQSMLRGADKIVATSLIAPLKTAHRSGNRAIPSFTSSSIATPRIRPTGGSRTAQPPKRC